MPSRKETSQPKEPKKTIQVHGHWRHFEGGNKTYIQQAKRHVKK